VMDLHNEVAGALLVMARDSDNLVRRTAAEVLGKVQSRESIEMLLELTGDSSPRVRETAAASLDGIKDVRDPSPDKSRAGHGDPAPFLETAP
jgi:HEAT repeat protein